MRSKLPIVGALVLLLAAGLRFLLFWSLLRRLSAEHDQTVAQALHLDKPEARYQALYELQQVWNPVRAVETTAYEWRLLWVLIPLAFALWLWFRSKPEPGSKRRLLDGLALASMPFFGGLIGYTGYVRTGFSALAEAGLANNPGFIGSIIGEAAAVPITGLYLSVALGVVLWWLRRREAATAIPPPDDGPSIQGFRP